jgi:hypothetical protein
MDLTPLMIKPSPSAKGCDLKLPLMIGSASPKAVSARRKPGGSIDLRVVRLRPLTQHLVRSCAENSLFDIAFSPDAWPPLN